MDWLEVLKWWTDATCSGGCSLELPTKSTRRRNISGITRTSCAVSAQGLAPLLDAAARICEGHRAGRVPEGAVAELVEAVAGADLDYVRDEVPKALERSARCGARDQRGIARAMSEDARSSRDTTGLSDVNRLVDNALIIAHNELKYVAGVDTDLEPGLPVAAGAPGDVTIGILHLLTYVAAPLHASSAAAATERTNRRTRPSRRHRRGAQDRRRRPGSPGRPGR